jgi:hypothetical protein
MRLHCVRFYAPRIVVDFRQLLRIESHLEPCPIL